MKILYSDGGLFKDDTHSIFLAGPTPRSSDVLSWRPQAIDIIQKLNYDGTVLVPERKNWESRFDYKDQIEWELDSLSKASSIVFWIPRNMKNMPALTTNVEFGYWLADTPHKILYGRPDNAEHIGYLDFLYSKHVKQPIHNDLKNLLERAVTK